MSLTKATTPASTTEEGKVILRSCDAVGAGLRWGMVSCIMATTMIWPASLSIHKPEKLPIVITVLSLLTVYMNPDMNDTSKRVSTSLLPNMEERHRHPNGEGMAQNGVLVDLPFLPYIRHPYSLPFTPLPLWPFSLIL